MTSTDERVEKLVTLGIRFLHDGDPEAAVEQWRAALAIDPTNELAQQYLKRVRDQLSGSPNGATARIDIASLNAKIAESWIDSPDDDVEIVVANEDGAASDDEAQRLPTLRHLVSDSE